MDRNHHGFVIFFSYWFRVSREFSPGKVQEELKVQDVQETVVFVDRPVYIPEEKSNPSTERKNRTGVDAVNDSQKKATQKPENYKSGTFFY